MPMKTVHGTTSEPYSPFLDKELTGCLIDTAWISFVTRTLTTPTLLGRPDVVRELDRLENSGEIAALRHHHNHDIDLFLDTLLFNPPHERSNICLHSGLTLQALALDRVQAATFRLVETARPDRATPLETVEPLIKLFRNVLSGKPV